MALECPRIDERSLRVYLDVKGSDRLLWALYCFHRLPAPSIHEVSYVGGYWPPSERYIRATHPQKRVQVK